MNIQPKTPWKSRRHPQWCSNLTLGLITDGAWISAISVIGGLVGCTLLILIASCNPARAEEIKTGKASWYSYESCRKEGTSGRLTASGSPFNHHAQTAAMWDVPFGSKFKVTNLANGKNTIVEINDRGPAKRLVKKGRIIDLSKGAFSKIASLREGMIKVSVERVQ